MPDPTIGDGQNQAPISPFSGVQMPQITGLIADPSVGKYIDPATGYYATPDQIAGAKKAETQYQEEQIGATLRGQDISAADSARSNATSAANAALSAGAAARGQDISAGTAAASLAQSGQQFQQSQAQQQAQYDASQQFAKEQWLATQQLQIQQLTLQQETLATTQANNARNYQAQLVNQKFLEDKFKFESSVAITQEARATQQQMFGQQATVANLQLSMAQITQQANDTNAQLKNSVELFNAGKSADVSMFNIDQKTKVAQFNSQMAFDVQKANADEKARRDQQLIDVADKISKAGADPGDRGALASMIQALGPEGFGSADAAIAKSNGSLITNDSLVPLESELRTRDDIRNRDPNPFKFTPIEAGTASFTPATAAQVAQPDFSGVNVPTPNTTPFDASAAQALANKTASAPVSPQNFDSTQQGFIANGTTSVPGEQLNTGGQALTAEQRAQIPDYALQSMIDSGLIPKMARGGTTDGAYIGDERGAEMHIPLPDGNRLVIPHNMVGQTPFGGSAGPTTGFGDAPAQMPANRPQMPNWQPSGPIGNSTMPAAGKNEWESVQGLPQLRNLASAVGGLQSAHPELHSLLTNLLMGKMPNFGGMPHEAEGGVVAGPYMGSNDGADVNIPIPGTNMTVIMKKPAGKKGAGGKASKLPKHATGGLFDQQGTSIYEGLLTDNNRDMATNFLDEASRRAANGTPFNINHLPTPVGVSSPGTSPYLANLLASLNSIKRGVPQGYFMEQAALDRPVAMSEGTVGRSG